MFGVALGLNYPSVDATQGIAAGPLLQLAGHAIDFSLRFTGACAFAGLLAGFQAHAQGQCIR